MLVIGFQVAYGSEEEYHSGMFGGPGNPMVILGALIAAAACFGFLYIYGERFFP
jgi:hypothetical protein